ncbi:MAG: distal tail protein Dit [Candidatus Heimdallarchaeaceae archaeon]
MARLDFSFAAVSALTKNFDTQKIIIPPLAEQKETKIDIPKVPGLTQLFKKFTKREIKVRGMLHGTNHEDLIAKIENFSAFLFSEDDEQLIFNNQPDRFYLAQHIKSIELIRNPTFALLELQFTCNDPFGYAITADSDTQSGITVKDTTWDITNSGQYWAFPVITITFNQVQTHIYLQNNNISGNRFDISKSFGPGNILEVDSKNMTIKLNSAHSPAGFGDGGESRADFILLKKGLNQMQIGTDDASIDVDVTITFRKVYL